MKKVGILSLQRIQNYGSFLQAYGLKSILEQMGCEVQFVDYHPGETLIPGDGGTGFVRNLYKVVEVLKQRGPLKEKIRFIKYKKNYSKKYFPYLGITEERNYFPELDLLIIGSDEVFNCVQNNTNVGFSSELFGAGNKAKKLISYAASFGNTTLEVLDEHNVKNDVAEWLKNFDAVSVRDKNSFEIVNKLTGVEPVYNLDPVMIYEYLTKCSRVPQTVPESRYVLLYGYSGRFNKRECDSIRRFAKNKGLKILCIGGVQDCCDRFIDVDPFTVIAYFQHAEYVVTDTFHGTVISIITHKKFVSVVRDNGYANSQKVRDLLQRLDLENRELRKIDDLDRIEEKIEYDLTDRIIQNERQKAYKYLGQWVNC